MKPKIYLAGPDVFYKDTIAQATFLKKKCETYGFEGVFPLDNQLDLSVMTKHQGAQAIYQSNIEMIDHCDGVLVNMQPFRGPGMDGGSAFEMGYATAKGKPVVGYLDKTELYFERVRKYYQHLEECEGHFFDPNALMVEDFDLTDNLMMACSAYAIVHDLDEALSILKALYVPDE